MNSKREWVCLLNNSVALFKCHCEERSGFLVCHCEPEGRSNLTQEPKKEEIAAALSASQRLRRIATLPLEARNDDFILSDVA